MPLSVHAGSLDSEILKSVESDSAPDAVYEH